MPAGSVPRPARARVPEEPLGDLPVVPSVQVVVLRRGRRLLLLVDIVVAAGAGRDVGDRGGLGPHGAGVELEAGVLPEIQGLVLEAPGGVLRVAGRQDPARTRPPRPSRASFPLSPRPTPGEPPRGPGRAPRPPGSRSSSMCSRDNLLALTSVLNIPARRDDARLFTGPGTVARPLAAWLFPHLCGKNRRNCSQAGTDVKGSCPGASMRLRAERAGAGQEGRLAQDQPRRAGGVPLRSAHCQPRGAARRPVG